MELSLLKVAQEGDTNQLQTLLEEDPILLQKFALSDYPDSPLHIAVLAGQVNFAREILKKMRSFVWDQNKAGLTALHMASAMGNADIVREILKVSGPSLCLMKDEVGLTSLHLAAMKGRIEVIEEILQVCPEALRGVTADGETVFHLAVVYSQFEALGILVDYLRLEDQEVLYAVDCLGNNVFQLAQRPKQLMVLKYLLKSQAFRKQDSFRNQSENLVRQELKLQGMSLSTDFSDLRNEKKYDHIKAASHSPLKSDQTEEEEEEHEYESASEDTEERDSERTSGGIAGEITVLLASILAGVTYIAVASPPKFLREDDMKLDTSCLLQMFTLKRSFNLAESRKQCLAVSYYGFMGFNGAGLLCAVYMIISQAQRIPRVMKFLFPTSIFLMGVSYSFFLMSMIPNLGCFFIVCCLVFGLILYTFHTFCRFLTWLKKPNKETEFPS